MTLLNRHAGVWKEGDPSVRDGGIIKPWDKGFVMDGGVHKEFYTSFTPPNGIGDFWEGGYYAGLIMTGGAAYAIIMASKVSGGESSATLQWKTSRSTTAGTDSTSDGVANTAAMMALGDEVHPAASFCHNLTIGGHSDWYLPSKDEMEVIYRRFKPTTQSNDTGSGSNPSSVPPSGNYANSNPQRTGLGIFRSGGVEAFEVDIRYWSSTYHSSVYAWYQEFDTGRQGGRDMTNESRVRAIRRVLVPESYVPA